MAVSMREYQEYVRSMKIISDNAQAALLKLWGQLDTTDMDTLRADLMRYLPVVIERYGKASAVASAKFYDAVRSSYIAEDGFIAYTAGSMLDNKRLKTDILYALSDDFTGESVTSFLSGVVDMQVKSYGRETMQYNAEQDNRCRGYVSVPSDDACAFCVMKAIGTYYNYQGETLLVQVDVDAWHAHCNCQLMPVFGDLPAWWRGMASECEDMYRAGANQAFKDTEEARMQRVEEFKNSKEYAQLQTTQKGRAEAAKHEANLKNQMTPNEVLAGMRKANGLEH